MKLKKIASLASVGITVIATSLILSSCSCKISEEQLKTLSDLRRQEQAVNADITSLQNEKSKTEREIQARKSEADECNQKRQIVKQRLSSWPNIWPEYTPQP